MLQANHNAMPIRLSLAPFSAFGDANAVAEHASPKAENVFSSRAVSA